MYIAYYKMVGGRRLGLEIANTRAEAIRRVKAKYYYLRLLDYEIDTEKLEAKNGK